MNVSVRELKARLSEYLRRVQLGEEVVIIHRGTPVGRIVPIRETEVPTEAEVVRRLRQLPWIRAGASGKPLGSGEPLHIPPGEKTLSDAVIEDRG